MLWTPPEAGDGDHVAGTDQFGMASAGGTWAKREAADAVTRIRTAAKSRFIGVLRDYGRSRFSGVRDTGQREWARGDDIRKAGVSERTQGKKGGPEGRRFGGTVGV
jgi:hypothetical protein